MMILLITMITLTKMGRTISNDDIVDFYNNYYADSKMTIVIMMITSTGWSQRMEGKMTQQE